jgi:hypothetical protein
MAEQMIAYCGIVCSECPAYVATQAGDMAALARVAAEWSEGEAEPFTAQDCLCDGCTTDAGRLFKWCREGCDVRVCAVGRGVVTCAHCDDYGCETITRFFDFAPGAEDLKARLDEIRQAL